MVDETPERKLRGLDRGRGLVGAWPSKFGHALAL